MISNPAATKPIPQGKQRHCSGPQRPLQQNGMKIEEDYKIQTSTNHVLYKIIYSHIILQCEQRLPVSNIEEARLPRLLLEVTGHPHSLLRAQPVVAAVRCHGLKIHEVNVKTHENYKV